MSTVETKGIPMLLLAGLLFAGVGVFAPMANRERNTYDDDHKHSAFVFKQSSEQNKQRRKYQKAIRKMERQQAKKHKRGVLSFLKKKQ
jgi:hypothetical protein